VLGDRLLPVLLADANHWLKFFPSLAIDDADLLRSIADYVAKTSGVQKVHVLTREDETYPGDNQPPSPPRSTAVE
jgi:hypothetical protein